MVNFKYKIILMQIKDGACPLYVQFTYLPKFKYVTRKIFFQVIQFYLIHDLFFLLIILYCAKYKNICNFMFFLEMLFYHGIELFYKERDYPSSPVNINVVQSPSSVVISCVTPSSQLLSVSVSCPLQSQQFYVSGLLYYGVCS